MSKKPTVAFVCVHNACRSQIAEALGRLLAADVFDSVSAGTAPKEHIDPTAVRMVREMYGVEMELAQHSKRLEELPPVDGVVNMGCGVACPALPCAFREDWGLSDPTGQGEEAYKAVIRQIEGRILRLRERLQQESVRE